MQGTYAQMMDLARAADEAQVSSYTYIYIYIYIYIYMQAKVHEGHLRPIDDLA